MSKPGWRPVLLRPEHFYELTGYQQWFLARFALQLSSGDGWRWRVVDGDWSVQVEAVAGAPGTPFAEPAGIQVRYGMGPYAGPDGVELLHDQDGPEDTWPGEDTNGSSHRLEEHSRDE